MFWVMYNSPFSKTKLLLLSIYNDIRKLFTSMYHNYNEVHSCSTLLDAIGFSSELSRLLSVHVPDTEHPSAYSVEEGLLFSRAESPFGRQRSHLSCWQLLITAAFGVSLLMSSPEEVREVETTICISWDAFVVWWTSTNGLSAFSVTPLLVLILVLSVPADVMLPLPALALLDLACEYWYWKFVLEVPALGSSLKSDNWLA